MAHTDEERMDWVQAHWPHLEGGEAITVRFSEYDPDYGLRRYYAQGKTLRDAVDVVLDGGRIEIPD